MVSEIPSNSLQARQSQKQLRATKRRIVLSTFGSLGDLHPFIALALELRKRGHHPLIATSEIYREKITSLGLEFAPIRPDHPDWHGDPVLTEKYMSLRKGTEAIVREFLFPALRHSYDDLMAVILPDDVLISHPLTYAASIVAEKKNLLWVSVCLQPLGFFSVYDPPVLPPAQFFDRFRWAGPAFYRPLFRFMRFVLRNWSVPWHQLRAEVGLTPTSKNPMFEGQFSSRLTLALFSKHFATPQIDWPVNSLVTGFPFFDEDRNTDADLSPELKKFLDSGPPPLVFTLGSFAVKSAQDFYEQSLEASRILKMRAVFLTGRDIHKDLGLLSRDEIAVDYAPFSKLFPHAAATIHSGGIGTTGHAMAAGRPMIIMPYANDQPDNAARIVRLGLGLSVQRDHYSAHTAAKALRRILNEKSFSQRAAEIGPLVAHENGIKTACDALEDLFSQASNEEMKALHV